MQLGNSNARNSDWTRKGNVPTTVPPMKRHGS